MTLSVDSLYTACCDRPLTRRLGLAPNAFPAGGNFYPEEKVLALLADLALMQRPQSAVALGCGPQVVVLAAAMAQYGGSVWVLESDQRAMDVTRAALARVGLTANLIHADLVEYDRHNLWYAVTAVRALPAEIGLLFIDGPGHFAGRMPRWPAGPELFHRLSADGTVVLDDAGRVKEKKALARWADAFPDWLQSRPIGGAAQLCRG